MVTGHTVGRWPVGGRAGRSAVFECSFGKSRRRTGRSILSILSDLWYSLPSNDSTVMVGRDVTAVHF